LTGANGFIGRQVLSQLGDRFELHCTSRKPIEAFSHWHPIDLRDSDACTALIKAVRPEILVHAAWNTEHGEFWEATDNDDWLEAGRVLFSAFAKAGGRRIVACGSCAEYPGMSNRPRRECETIELSEPATRYGRAKLALLSHLRDLPIDHAWARIFYPYGEHENEHRLVPSIATALRDGRPALCSSGRQVRDFIDVRELGRSIALLAKSSLTGVINLGQGAPISIAQLAFLLGEIAGKPELIELGALPDRLGEPALLVPDLTRQTKELGFRPAIDLRRGLCDALKFWATRN
jgi:nucleoside-diphosphate-sugar epimerase